MIQVNFHDKWTPEPFSGCWLWPASVRPDGYGQVRFNGKMEGRIIHRGCGGDSSVTCVRHSKLCESRPSFLGTNTDNMRDASKKHRFNQVGQNNGAAKLTELDVAVDQVDGGNATRNRS